RSWRTEVRLSKRRTASETACRTLSWRASVPKYRDVVWQAESVSRALRCNAPMSWVCWASAASAWRFSSSRYPTGLSSWWSRISHGPRAGGTDPWTISAGAQLRAPAAPRTGGSHRSGRVLRRALRRPTAAPRGQDAAQDLDRRRWATRDDDVDRQDARDSAAGGVARAEDAAVAAADADGDDERGWRGPFVG